MFRFSSFELDPQRAELRGPDGKAIKLRPKTFDMLSLFAANAGRVVSKQELIEAIWPNVHVGEDGLFQCIREIRTALGDDRRELVKLISGRGYLLDAEVSTAAACLPVMAPAAGAEPVAAGDAAAPRTTETRFRARAPAARTTLAGFGAVFGLTGAALIFAPGLIFKPMPPEIAVMDIAAAGDDPQSVAMAAAVTQRLVDGLAKIEDIRVVAPGLPAAAATPAASARAASAKFVVSGALQKSASGWTLQARTVESATGEVQPVAPVSVDVKEPDLSLQQSRLAAGIGHALALRFNAVLNAGARPARTGGAFPEGSGKVAIEQAIASINQTTRERFATAQTILEKALASDTGNIDVEVALAALKLRGIQMVWYSPEGSVAAENDAKAMLEHAVRARPNYIPVLEAYCRFLNTTNYFVDSLVACARTLSFDPWNGIALYHIGLAQLQLGRFDDALATFKQADRYDTPQVSRWTWLLGAGLTLVVMGRYEEAIPWLQKSLAITVASGRTHMMLAAAYQGLGRLEEARAAMKTALALRPGSTSKNVALPPKNASPVFLAASDRVMRAAIAAGLPEQ